MKEYIPLRTTSPCRKHFLVITMGVKSSTSAKPLWAENRLHADPSKEVFLLVRLVEDYDLRPKHLLLICLLI